ncbi:hypothetical protein CALVIDRAFT_285691 [Calocera viscosa TUFC12733]|uniref:C2 domain-containing protein n=1 Tax=Calocera viscosa (strain TUFC12733) TaxID=1330018 RepID=A0A167IV68_CALVF|nr:hypothetical protein CALVIDRAFT_285691 [Calocera viscosa TUFC12733]
MSSGPPAANASNLGTSTATVTPDGLPEHIEGRVLFQGVRVHGLPPVYIGLPPVRIVVPKYYCVLRVGDADEPLWKSKDVAQDGFVVKWGDDIQFSVPVTVQLTFEVYLAHPVGQDQQVLRFVQTIQSLLRTCTDAFCKCSDHWFWMRS